MYVPGKSPFAASPDLRVYLEREFQSVARAIVSPEWPRFIAAGVHDVLTNVVFTEPVTFENGAILRPANGVTITFEVWPDAPIGAQIFDLSLALTGTAIVWPAYQRSAVHAAWFGAIPAAEVDKDDQNIELQYALDSLGGRGGIVELMGGDYFCSDAVLIAVNTIIRGQGHLATALRVSASWNNVTAYFVRFANGTAPQFGCRLETLSVTGSDVAFVTELILADSWNEACGLDDVWVRGFMKNGLQLQNYYGGAATSTISRSQFFVSDNATDALQAAINLVDNGASAGWFQLVLDHVVVIGNATNGATNFVGVRVDGREKLVVNGLHGEACLAVVGLSQEASCFGSSIQAAGDGSAANVFSVAANWTGKICVAGVNIGGASKVVLDNRTSPASLMTIGNQEVHVEPFVYPPDPARAIAGGRFVGTATPSIVYARGISAVALQATGQFRFTLSPVLGDASLYDVVAQVYHSATLASRVVNNSGSAFDVFFTDMANGATDPDGIGIKVYHRAGGAAT